MRTTLRFALPAGLLLAACNAANNNALPDAAGVTDGSNGGGSTDMALGPDDKVLTMTPFTVAAGQEVFKCQNFANPFGADAEVREFESHMAPGSHHLLVFYKQDAVDGALEDCSGLEFSAGPYGAQSRDAVITYPDGVAALIPANQGLRFASHYLNATPDAITAQVRVIMRRAKAGTVTAHAGIFFFNNVNLFIQPSPQPQTVTKTCVAPQDMTILYSTGHMHKHATNLTATLDGAMIYSTDSWDSAPFKQFAPALQVKKGQSFTFTCSYINTTNAPLTFGESAVSNEMCIFDGQYYPNPSGQGIGCI